MKRTTSNKLNMYQTVMSVMNDHQAIWQGVPAVTNAMGSLSSKVSQLRTKLGEQAIVTPGVADEKQLHLSDLKERVMVMQQALYLHGRSSGDVALKKRNDQTRSFILKLNTAKFAVRCAELKHDLDVYGAELFQYGITHQAIDELLPNLLNVNEVNITTRQAILKRKTVTESINDMEREIDELLHSEMDRLALVFKFNEPTFFQAYRSARLVIDYGTHSERDDGSDV